MASMLISSLHRLLITVIFRSVLERRKVNRHCEWALWVYWINLRTLKGCDGFRKMFWPHFTRSVTFATLEVIGRNPSPRLENAIKREGIRVIGQLTTCDVSCRSGPVIAPLRIARGDSKQSPGSDGDGQSVIATPLGCRRDRSRSDKHFVIADSPTDGFAHWSKSVKTLLSCEIR